MRNMLESSAGITRGLIEADRRAARATGPSSSLPRGLPAASLKPDVFPQPVDLVRESSAGITRGLIEAGRVAFCPFPA